MKKPKISYDEFYKLDLRVATVSWASRLAGTGRLLKIKLDVGELGQRVVVSAIGQWYGVKDLLDTQVVYLANLKKKRVRGVVSEGSLLVISQYDANGVERQGLVHPGGKMKNGTVVK